MEQQQKVVLSAVLFAIVVAGIIWFGIIRPRLGLPPSPRPTAPLTSPALVSPTADFSAMASPAPYVAGAAEPVPTTSATGTSAILIGALVMSLTMSAWWLWRQFAATPADDRRR